MTPGVLRIAVDAGDLARDRRGLGRATRAVLRVALDDAHTMLTLLADRSSDVRALRAEYPHVAIERTASAGARDRYDVVWFPFNAMRFGTAAPAVVSIADAFAFTYAHPSRIARAREQRPINRAARDAARIVTLSQWSRGELERELGIDPQKIVVVPLAPSDYWFPRPGDPLPAQIATARFALIVGVREARKNARLALDACARAFRDPCELLVIAGDLARADVAFARSLGVRAGTIAASDATLRALYRNASAVLVPSLAEGFGLVAVEAMACGAPVIAANTSALPEATGGGALLCDPGDAAAWAAAIRTLFDDSAATADLRARAAARIAATDRNAPAYGLLATLRETAHG